jgi:FKBP-type peptidyl-prolyl cis-trans isomerase FkpA
LFGTPRAFYLARILLLKNRWTLFFQSAYPANSAYRQFLVDFLGGVVRRLNSERLGRYYFRSEWGDIDLMICGKNKGYWRFFLSALFTRFIDSQEMLTVKPSLLVTLFGVVPLLMINGCQSGSNEPFVELDSGLRYRVLRQSANEKPNPTQSVEVHYRGWLDSGRIFDNSYSRNKPFLIAPPWRVIEGWKEGLQLIGAGGKIELQIPPELGYGVRGQGSIPPNATLFFEIEILKVISEPTSE